MWRGMRTRSRPNYTQTGASYTSYASPPGRHGHSRYYSGRYGCALWSTYTIGRSNGARSCNSKAF